MKIIKWTVIAITTIILLFLLITFVIMPLFWKASYSGDGEYTVQTHAPLLYNFELSFPEFSLNEESTVTYKVKRIVGRSFFDRLIFTSENPVHISQLDTIVSASLKNSKGETIYHINLPINEMYISACPKTIDYSSPEGRCRELSNDEEYKINQYSYATYRASSLSRLHTSWWEDYELTISVKQPDTSYGEINAKFEIINGWK